MNKLYILLLSIVLGNQCFCQGFLWAKTYTSTQVNDIDVDAAGNVYSTGFFGGTQDYDPGAGTYTVATAGSTDAYLQKLDANGNIVWAKNFGGTGDDRASDLTVDAIGNVYVTGYFQGTADFDPGAGTYSLTANSQNDVFIVKLNANGNFVWAKSFGGGGTTSGNSGGAIKCNGSNLYVTGFFSGTVTINSTPSNYTLTSTGAHDVFVSRLDTAGNFVWIKQMGGNNSTDEGVDIAIDAIGNVYTIGYYSYFGDFDPGPATYILNNSGAFDSYVSKLDANGNFVWAKNISSTMQDYLNSIALDAAGNVFIGGVYGQNADFDPGPGTYTLSAQGNSDICVCKLDNNGNFVWAKSAGVSCCEYAMALALDAAGNVYSTGQYTGTIDFDPGTATYNLTSNTGGYYDIYILKLDNNGNFATALSMGGPMNDGAYAMTIDPTGNIYTTGYFYSTADFDPGPGTYSLTSAGLFVSKLGPNAMTVDQHSFSNDAILNVYPNPSNGSIDIVSKEDMNLNIINNLGQIIRHITLNNSLNHKQSIADLSPGIYYLVGENKDISVTQKIIVTH